MSAAASEVRRGYGHISAVAGWASEPQVDRRTQRDHGIEVAIQHSGGQGNLLSVSGTETMTDAAFPQALVSVTRGWGIRPEARGNQRTASPPTPDTVKRGFDRTPRGSLTDPQ